MCQGSLDTPAPGPFLACSRLPGCFVKCLVQATSQEQDREGA